MPLIQIQQLKDRLQITDGTQDDLLNSFINGVSDFIEGQCHRKFGQQSYTAEQHNVMHKVFPKNSPIVSVQAIRRVILDVDATPQYIDVVNYRVYPSYIDLLDPVFVTMSDKLQYALHERTYVEIDYTAGYGSVPNDIQTACLDLCAIKYNMNGSEHLKAERMGDYQVQYFENDIPPITQKIIDSYKKVGI